MLGISETRENYSLGFKVNNDFDGYILGLVLGLGLALWLGLGLWLGVRVRFRG